MADLKVQPGSIRITECRLLKQSTNTATDVLSLVESVTIFEDLFSPFITGKVKLLDTLDFLNSDGQYGPDLLKLRLESAENNNLSIDEIFVVYKIADRVAVGERVQTYSLYFASGELLHDINNSISRKFSGTGVDIIKKIMDYLKTVKPLNYDDTGNKLTYVSNFWNPTKNFSYITSHCYGVDQDSSFLFYQNRDGFNFKTVGSLIGKKNAIIQNFISSNYTGIVGPSGTTSANRVIKDMDREYANILGFRVDMTYDFMKDYLDGSLLSKMYSNDPITKKIRWGTFNSSNQRTALNLNHLYPKSIIDALNPVVANINRSYGMFNNEEYSNYSRIQARTGILRSLQSSKVEIDVYGNTAYTVGRKVNLNMNQLRRIVKTDSDSDIVDKLYSGDYLITAIAHHILRDGYRCTIELSKESTLLK